MPGVDGSVQNSFEARIVLKTRPQQDDVKTSCLVRPELVIPRLKDGEVFQNLISVMKGPHPQKLATIACESTASINVEDLFGNSERRNTATLPPVWQTLLKEMSAHSPEA